MNDFTALVYLILLVMLTSATFAYMWRLMGSTLNEFDRPQKHPELQEVKNGEELLAINFDYQRSIEDIELHRDLVDRINELEDEDDEGDGDIPARPYVGGGI